MISIKDKKDCCGCTACISICSHQAISMCADTEGFLYPIVNKDKCIGCGLCNKVCPLLSPPIEEPIHMNIYAALNKSVYKYLHSSSGGVFIQLCEEIIKQQGIVCGAVYDNNFVVKHQFRETIEGCYDFQTSKYVQSDIIGVFPKIKRKLRENRKILFSGTPCQVAGLKSYLKCNYENLYTCDIICHGVPSPAVFEDYKRFVAKGRRITSINMKSKNQKNGNTTFKFKFVNGEQEEDTLAINIWKELYFNHYISRPSCYACLFTNMNRPSDITIGDFWHYQKKHPNFHDGKAISLVLVSSHKGEELFSSVQHSFFINKSSKEECLQPQLQYPSPIANNRKDFWETYQKESFQAIAKQYGSYTIGNRLKEFIKNKIK